MAKQLRSYIYYSEIHSKNQNLYVYLLYKAEELSVCLSVMQVTHSCLHGLMPDVHDMIAMSSGISMLLSKSF